MSQECAEFLFRLKEFKNKGGILKRIKELIIKDITIKIFLNISTHHIKDLKLVLALPTAADKSCNINNKAKVSLFVKYISHSGTK